jgi:hypothetical protein
VEEAVLSLLAGDIFGGWAVRSRLMIFRAIFYATKLSHRLRAMRAPRTARVAVAAKVAG